MSENKKERKVKINHIKWEDFLEGIKLFRVITPKNLKYRGEITVDGKKYEDNHIFDATTYHENKDQISYIDKFAKEQIANKLVVKINKKRK